MSHDIKSNFRKNLCVIREGHIEEGWKDTSIAKDTVDFAKTTGKDVALSAVPFYSAGQEGSTAYERFKKGNYLSAAKHAAAAAAYTGIDALTGYAIYQSLGAATPYAAAGNVAAKTGLRSLGKSLFKRFATKQGEKIAAAETGKSGVKAITGSQTPKALPSPETPKALPPPSQSKKAPPPPPAPKAPAKSQGGISAEPWQFKGGEAPKAKPLSQIKQELPKPTKTKEAPTNIETMPMQKAGEPISTNKSLTVQSKKPQEIVKVEPKTTTITKVEPKVKTEPKTKVETKPETKTKTKDKEGKKGKRPFIPPLGLGLPSIEQPKPLKPGDFGLKPTITTPQAVAGTKAAQPYEMQSARQQAKIWNIKETYKQKLNEKKKDNKEDDSEVTGPPPKTLKFGFKAKTHSAKAVVGSKAAQAHSFMKTRREAEQFVKEEDIADILDKIVKKTKSSEFTLKDKINAQRGELKPVVGSKADQAYQNMLARQQAKIWNKKQQNESNLSTIKNMVENKIPSAELSFDDRSVTINNRIAKKLINIYESLNKENRKKVEQMLNEDISSYKKLINFAIRQ